MRVKTPFFIFIMITRCVFCYGEGRWGLNTQSVMLDIVPVAAPVVGAAVAAKVYSGIAVRGLGAGIQYEYVLYPGISIGCRSAYTLVSAQTRGFTLDIHSLNIEGHIRWYPWRREVDQQHSFFFDTFSGYAGIMLDLSSELSEMIGYKEIIKPYIEDADFAVIHYFRGGLKTGWKFILWESGQYGSLVTEVALGYALALGGGDDIEKKTKVFNVSIDKDIINALGGLIFAGGPRLSLNIGWLF